MLGHLSDRQEHMFASMESARSDAMGDVGQSGHVFWITGMSGTGKTTIGRELWLRLRASGRAAVFLDGDTLREVVSDDLGHTAEHRRLSAMRNGRLCQMLAAQGLDVVCATISLFHDVQRWNRTNIPGYREIYLRVPFAELERRDPKGIYARARRGELTTSSASMWWRKRPRCPIWFSTVTPRWAPPLRGADLEPAGRAEVPSRADDGKTVCFSTKSETLERLAPHLRHGRVLPQVRFTVAQWRDDPALRSEPHRRFSLGGGG